MAEEEAVAGDEALRTLATSNATRHFERAAQHGPYNADYPFRAARARSMIVSLLIRRSISMPEL